MTRRRVLASGLALVVLAAVVVAGVLVVRRLATSPQERYCATVVAQRAELSDRLSAGTPDVLITALPVFEDLQDDAPSDITDEWRQVVDAIRGLRDALDATGVDPATYDRTDPPDGVGTAETQRIDDAAGVLGSQETSAALADLDQQARDLCRTPLTQ